MEYRILGPLEVRDGDGVTPLPRRRERALLAALLLRPGEVVSTDRLVEAIWGETPPRTVVGSLQNAVSELRKALGHDVVVTRAPGYVLAVDADTIDAVRFERAVSRAAGLGSAERAEALAAALALWRGPALADLADESFASNEAARLDELRLAATEDRIAADLELGRGADLVAELEAHVAANPLRERLRGQLMLALYRAGRQAEALEAYQDARRALVDGLGIDPSPALQELERRVLRQDPTLLASEAAPREATPVVGAVPTRKTITVLAAALDDVSEIDPEPLRARVDRFLEALSEAAGRHGGTLDRFLGSEAVAVFGVPHAHEDDSLRAARAAVELREAVAAEGDAVRIGIATGEALVSASDMPVVGDVVAVAAALRDAAPRDAILAAEPTHSLVRDAVVAGEPLTVGPRKLAARPLEAVQGAHGRARRVDTPFVGRELELAGLRDALGDATGEGRCVAVTVLGDAGIGKTRLSEQLATTLVRGRLLEARCVPYGEGATFVPVLELVHRAAGGTGEDAVARLLPATEDGRLAARQIAALADASSPVPRGEAFWAVRVLLESLAREDPLVVVLDDIHWAEPALLDLVEYLVERVAAPVVLVCLARPELLDVRPGWAGATSEMTLMRLGPLAGQETDALLDSLGDDAIDERTRKRLTERGEGNPLHLEQLYAFVADEGGDPALEDVPPTVEAVLASRVDLLAPETRDTLQRAAVAGQGLTRGIVVALSEPGAQVDAALLELTRRGLLHPERTDGPDDAYRFHHALLRDVAYGSLPKAVRAVLHERAAAWLDRDGPGLDELVGWHLEQAHTYRTELRPGDPELVRLAESAGERLAVAGVRASKAADSRSAVSLLRRATSLMPNDARRAELLCELVPPLRTTGDDVRVRQVLEEARAVATAGDAAWLVTRAEMELAWEETAVGTVRSMESFRELLLAAIPVFEAAGDDRGLARAWAYLATTHMYEEQHERRSDAARRAGEHARKAGWVPLTSLLAQASSLVHGPRPVGAALAEAARLAQEADGNRPLTAALDSLTAVIHAMNGNHRKASTLMASSLEVLRDDDHLLIRTTWMPSQHSILRLTGDAAEARALLSRWSRELERVGDDAYLSTACAQLADLVVDERPEQAKRLLDEAAERASADDVLVQVLIRSTAARLFALRGARDHAVQTIDDARALVQPTDALNDRARVEVSAARSYELLGLDDMSERALRNARDLYELKENHQALWSLEKHGARALT